MTTVPENPLLVRESSQVGEIRRHAAQLARIALPEAKAGKIEIVVNEIATNIIKHGGSDGNIIVRGIGAGPDGIPNGIEVIGIDRGNGISNLAESLRDGVSTTRTQGLGLGGIKRLSDDFDIFTQPGQGTAVLSRLWRGPADASRARFAVGAVNFPIAGENVSGDAWAVHEQPGILTVIAADGLGHGPSAHAAARAAIDIFHENPTLPLPELMKDLHAGVRSTRGAAVALARIDASKELLYFCGVGNVGGAVLLHASQRRLASMNGTVGLQIGSPKEFSYPFPSDATLALFSDGILSRWDLEKHPGLLKKDPSLIAAVLHRDFTRGRDDSSVVIARSIPKGIA